MNKEFYKMQKLAGLITESQYKELTEEDSGVKQIPDNDIYSIKEPNSSVLVNGEKPFSLSQEELKPIKDAVAKPNIAKFKKMIILGPDTGTLSLANKKSEQRILKFFKSDKDTYYITVVGPGETSYDRTKHYTTNDKSAFIKFINKTLNEFSDWCDNQEINEALFLYSDEEMKKGASPKEYTDKEIDDMSLEAAKKLYKDAKNNWNVPHNHKLAKRLRVKIEKADPKYFKTKKQQNNE